MYPLEGQPDTSRSEMGLSSDDTDEGEGRGSDQGGTVNREDDAARRDADDDASGSADPGDMTEMDSKE